VNIALSRKPLFLPILQAIVGASLLFGQTPTPEIKTAPEQKPEANTKHREVKQPNSTQGGGGKPGSPGERMRSPEFPEAKLIAQPKNDQELADAIRQLAGELAAAGKFSGAILIAANGKILVDNAWGNANREVKTSNSPETAFDVGSIEKLFTQIAILQLAEAGKLKLDDPFGKYLTDYPNRDIANKISVRQLLLNSSGLPDIFERVAPGTDLKSMRNLKDFLPLFVQKPLEFEPGSQNHYSSSGYIVLGLVIEALSGEDYQTYVKQKILEPAGMDRSGFFDREHLPPTVARSYDDDQDVTGMHPVRGSSAGGLQATTGDLFRLVQAIDTGKLIAKESVGVLRKLIPAPPNAPPPADESKLLGYGIGGGGPGVGAQLAIDPTGHYTRVILSNGGPPMAMAMGAAIREWIKQMPK
jgi:D-alanyl-D-alanine carboxypeptidase